MAEAELGVIVAGKYDRIPIGAGVNPHKFMDWWFGYKAHQMGAAAGAVVGGAYSSPDGAWARQQYTSGSMYQSFIPDHAGPFWIDAATDADYYRAAVGDLSPSGGPPGPLGRPLQDTVDFVDGGRVSVFEHGHIYWWADTGARTLSPAKVDVRFDRLYCRVETDGPGSDEPYLILSMFGPDGAWVQMATFAEVDAGGTHRRDMTLYHGAPAGALLVATLWEHDSGNAEQAREHAAHILEASVGLVGKAVELIPGVGHVLAEEGLEPLMLALAEPLADLLGLEDDKIAGSRVLLSPKMMIVAATDDQVIGAAPSTLAELRFQGEGGDYSAYFVAYPGRSPIVPSPAAGNRMLPGQTLAPNEFLASDNGLFTLIYQTDGNLVLYRNADDRPLWSSNSSGTTAGMVVMQHDGNLVVYDPNTRAHYATGTNDQGSSIVVQDDGNLVMYSATGTPVWASNTVQ